MAFPQKLTFVEIPAKTCSATPPPAPAAPSADATPGKAVVKNTGMYFGLQCAELNVFHTVEGNGCNGIDLALSSGTLGQSNTYTLQITGDAGVDRAVAMLSFSQPITDAVITVLPAVSFSTSHLNFGT